ALLLESMIASPAPQATQLPNPEAVLPARVMVEAPYRLEPGDEIEVRFILHPEYNERASIRPDGCVSLPGIGEISLAGVTIAELTVQLKNSYQFLRNPDPLVQVRSFGNRKVYVGGEVNRPGPQVMLGPKTVAQAIVESGGMKESARR